MKKIKKKNAYSAITASISMMFIVATFVLGLVMLSPVIQNMRLTMEVDSFANNIAKNGGITSEDEVHFLGRLSSLGYNELEVEITIKDKDGKIPKYVTSYVDPVTTPCDGPCIKVSDEQNTMYLKVTAPINTTVLNNVASFFTGQFNNVTLVSEKNILSIRE